MKLLFAASLLSACAATAPSATPGPAPTDFTFRGQVADRTVTHVVAISEIDRVVTRLIAPVEYGEFSLAVPAAKPWLIVFIDDAQVGAGKTVGVLRAGTLDAMIAAAPGEVELGEIGFAGGTATAALDATALHAALGLDEGLAATLGAMDDFAVRYDNVDLDADGVFDGYQASFNARLDIEAGLRISAHGHAPSVADMIAGETELSYVGASIDARMPDSFGKFALANAQVTFDAPFFGLLSGAGTPVVPAGTPIRGADLVAGTDHDFGVYGRYNHPLPEGDYRFDVPAGTIEFPNVHATLPALAPFVRLGMTDACAAAACVPESLQFTWMQHTDAGWSAASDAEIALLRPTSSVDVLLTGPTGVSYRTYTLPTGVAAATLPWDGGGTLYSTATAAQPIADVQYLAVRYGVALGVASEASFAVTPEQLAPPSKQ